MVRDYSMVTEAGRMKCLGSLLPQEQAETRASPEPLWGLDV